MEPNLTTVDEQTTRLINKTYGFSSNHTISQDFYTSFGWWSQDFWTIKHTASPQKYARTTQKWLFHPDSGGCIIPATVSVWSGRDYQPCNVTSQWLLLKLLYNSGFHCSSTHHQPRKQVASHYFFQGKHFPPSQKLLKYLAQSWIWIQLQQKTQQKLKEIQRNIIFHMISPILHHFFPNPTSLPAQWTLKHSNQPTNQPTQPSQLTTSPPRWWIQVPR